MLTHIPITNRYELDGLGFEFFRGKILAVRLTRPHRILVATCLLFNGFRGSFPGIKWPVREADHSSPSGTDVKMSGAITLTKLLFHGVKEKPLLHTHTRMYAYLQQIVPSTYGYIPNHKAKFTVTH